MWAHQLPWRMHLQLWESLTGALSSLHASSPYVFAVIYTGESVYPRLCSQSFLLQNGGDGGATAVQWPGDLIAFIWWAANRSKPQRGPSHSWYVTETARFLAACCCAIFFVVFFLFVYIYLYAVDHSMQITKKWFKQAMASFPYANDLSWWFCQVQT